MSNICQKIANIILPLISIGLIGFTAIIALPTTKLGAEDFKLVQGGAAKVVEIVDGDTLMLKHAVGRGNMISNKVRLVGIQAPKLPLGRRNFKTWPLAEKSKKTLAELSLGKTVQLSFGGRRMDRHGRLLAHLHLKDGTWLQGELLLQGMARVYSFPDNRAAIADMLTREKLARQNRRGIWRLAFYDVRPQADLVSNEKKYKNSFQLVEGQVVDVAAVRKNVYLNFGDNWRNDFTVTLNAKALKIFAQSGFDPLSLKGKNIRVRGWIKSFNGPMINATHPEQIEVLSK